MKLSECFVSVGVAKLACIERFEWKTLFSFIFDLTYSEMTSSKYSN